MTGPNLVVLADLYKALGNVNRLKMLLLCAERGMTVTQLSQAVGLSYNLTSEYVNLLARRGLVERVPNRNKTVTVSARVLISEDGELRRRE